MSCSERRLEPDYYVIKNGRQYLGRSTIYGSFGWVGFENAYTFVDARHAEQFLIRHAARELNEVPDVAGGRITPIFKA